MTDKNYTHATFVVDCSTSMTGIASDMSGGINKLIEEQRLVDGRMTVSLLEFSGFRQERQIWDFVDINNAGKYNLETRGITALNDAVGHAINKTGDRLRDMPEALRPGKVIFVIVTDGLENDSREFNASQIKEMIQNQEKNYNWEFLFLGANIDAFAEGGKLGITSSIQYATTGQSVNNAYRGMSHSFAASRVATAAGKDVTVASTMATDYTSEEEQD